MASEVTNIELYEELKKSLTEPAARMIAEVYPAASSVATKDDLLQVEKRLEGRIHQVEQKIDRLETKVFRTALVMFMPMWIGVFAALVAIAWRV